MKKAKVMIVLLAALLIGNTLLAAGNLSFDVSFVSRYIWRGWDLNPDKKPALQPSMTYTFGKSGFAANLWFNFSFEDKNTNEIDLTLTYDFSPCENLGITLGFINYGWWYVKDFKFKDNTTQELFATVAFVKLPFKPAISLYYDINNGDGLYASLGVGHGTKISDKVAAEFSASLGYNAGQWLPEGVDSGFSDLNLGASFPITLDKFTITPFATYTFVLLDFIGNDNHFWFGLSIGF